MWIVLLKPRRSFSGSILSILYLSPSFPPPTPGPLLPQLLDVAGGKGAKRFAPTGPPLRGGSSGGIFTSLRERKQRAGAVVRGGDDVSAILGVLWGIGDER